jgi:uncharacterized caspase-like protein
MGQKYALLIGNTNYKNLPTLTTPDDDVKNLTRVLREPKIDGFNQVTPLVDRPINEIMPEVSKLFKDRKPDDLVLLYFSGHGVKDHDRDSLYLATYDTDSELLRATAIPSSFIEDEMGNYGSRQVVLIVDCCYRAACSPAVAEQKARWTTLWVRRITSRAMAGARSS